ncbi:aminotransferase class V-fold PLP-dependent enzyme [Candidatus Nitrosotenuis aquarius]|uniref:aminotransferase class V-fold PLP-dependent enzyme n=1 Tax=Candidatus Nitrosotenuis aquarius TaxID=1846278 RepID=UPI000C1E5DCC|nr:cysteine desulfurase [Candidatus Nitrosotenuis aquarius]
MQTIISTEQIRKDFPILQRKVRNGKNLVYLDNAATTQKPIQVINAITDFYTNHNSNIHRAVHALAEEATEAYEMTRDKIAKFLNIKDRQEIVFVRGTTEAINLVAYAWGRQNIKEGDIIVTTEYEHHSNIVPWQLLTQEKKGKLEYIAIDDNGELMLDQLDQYLATGKVKLVAVSQMSNVLGTITDVAAVIAKCKKAGVRVLIDGAQSVPHMKVDIDALGCDFFAFSGHKMLGPTGVGVLWAKKELLEQMAPFHGGGDMIREVHKYETTWNDLPYKFEAGTPNIADVIGFAAAIDYLNNIGMDYVRAHEIEITKYALDKLSQINGIKLYGTSDMSKRGGVISFNFADIHPHDLATIIDEDGVAIRSGHHCAQVLMEKLDIAATSRASFYIYNTKEEVDVLINSLSRAARLFKL